MTLQLTIAYLAEQPIIHTEESIGNISKIKKLRVIHDGQPVAVPALSGNSFRGQFRDILADQLCSRLMENGNKLRFENNEVYTILYSGGALGESSSSGELIKDFSENLPSMRLMGAAFGNVMLPSKFAATHITPLAKETTTILQKMRSVVQDIVPSDDALPEVRNLVFNDGPLTRKDDRRDLTKQRYVDIPEKASKKEEGEKKESASQMIYYVECIPPGTWLLQQLYSKFPMDELELGCFFDGLCAFLKQPSLGGRSAAGYGQVNPTIKGTLNDKPIELSNDLCTKDPVSSAIKAYQVYVAEKKEAIRKTLKVKANTEKDG